MDDVERVHETPLDRRVRETRDEVDRLRRARNDLDDPFAAAVASGFRQRDLASERNTADIDLRNAQNVLGELLLQQARQFDATAKLGVGRDASDDDLREDAKKREERREFWFRRFNLSLGLAHGAGLAAITTKIFDVGINAAIVAGTWWSMLSFALGLALAGILPVALYLERPKLAWWMAAASALLFLCALAGLLAAAASKAERIWPYALAG